MAKKQKTFMKLLSLFLLINIFALALSKEIKYDSGTKKANDSVDKAEALENLYTLKIEDGNDIPKYIKVTLTPKGEQKTPTLCYSSNDQNCKTNRVVLASRVDKKSVIACVKGNEIQSNSKSLYTTVTCKEAGCGFDILFEGQDRCQVDASDGTIYSYEVTGANNVMDFEAVGISGGYEIFFMNIGIEGSDSATITVNGVQPKLVKYDGAQMVTYQIENAEDFNVTSLANFTISGMKVGEFVRIAVYLSKNGAGPDNLLYPGGPYVLGVVYRNNIIYPELCLPVSAFISDEFSSYTQFYLTGKIYSKYALFWVGDAEKQYQQETDTEIKDGLIAFAVEPKGSLRHICFEFSFEDFVIEKDVLFSVKIVPIAGKNTPDFYFSNPPMILGQTYRNMLTKGKTVFYHGAQIDKDKGRYSFNLFNRKGVAQMYMADCTTFPNCNFNMTKDIEDPKKLQMVRNTGKISIYDQIIDKPMAVFDQNKKLMVIKCVDDGSDQSGYCEFDITINYKGQDIYLIEGENRAKYAIQGETGKFLIDFKNAVKLSNVGVEIMVHTGEVTFDSVTSLTSPFFTKYLLSNKVFFDFDLNKETCGIIEVSFKAIKNSFFTIKYVLDYSTATTPYSEEIIFPGESYMINMDPGSDTKTLRFNNDRYKSGQMYLTNFFAINCDFKVTTNKAQGGETEIPFADGYAQDTLNYDEGQIYSSSYYDYKVSIEKIEESNYNKKMCMLYVIGYQTMDLFYSTRIWIGNNINQQIIFNDFFTYIKFLYPVPDLNTDLVVYANIIDKAFYYINIAIDSEDNKVYRDTITKSTPYYLDTAIFSKNCTKNTFCNIIIEIQLVRPIESLPKTNHMVEITVREATKEGDYTLLRVPTYIQKGIAKKDFTTGDGYYYVYTDLGKNDQGDITVNFFRDYGEVYGRIVKKDSKDDGEEIEWMERYRLPGSEWKIDGVNYNKYLKKYHISIEDTEDCIGGCYLILGIIISQIGEIAEEWKFYPFSIITEISQNSYGQSTDIPVTTIQVDEFIIGNVKISNNVEISQFYKIWLPRDTYELYFDWQSELAGLYINVDDSLPTAANADFILKPNGTDSILVLEKNQILEAIEKKKVPLPYEGSLEDVKLTIGIWTDKTDSVGTELYSLRVHEVNIEQSDLDIYEVNTDQKILCKPKSIGSGKYYCLFMVTYDDQDVKQQSDLLVYATSTNKGDSTVMYASFISANIYNEFIADTLRGSIPNENSAAYDTINLDTNYFYIQLHKIQSKDQYLYVNVISFFPDDIMMVASMNCFDRTQEGNIQIFYPKAKTEQIVQAKEDSLILDFSVDSSLIVNIENLGGEADLRWEEDDQIVHYLRGKGDRLTLTTSTNYKRLLIKKLKSDKPIKEKDPGFVFIFDYYSRDSSKNFDEVVYGSSIEMAYRDTDLPVYMYSKKVDYSNDINIAVTFRDSRDDTEGEYTTTPIEVRAFLDKRDLIYAAKATPEFEPYGNKIDGIYDPAIKTAQVFLPDLVINLDFKIDPKDYPTLLLFLGKSNAYEDKVYKTFDVEAQFTRTNSLVVPNEKVYNYGKFNGLITQYYKLRKDTVKKIMKIVISFNGDLLTFSIGDRSNPYNQTEKFTNKTEIGKGKILITIEPPENMDFIYLNVYKKSYMEDPNTHIQNYAFKYINVESDDQFFDYGIKNNNGSLTYKDERKDGKVTITATFNRVDIDKGKANITYFLKIVDSRTYIPGEDFNTVAVTESPYFTKYKRNPDFDATDKITLSATGDFQYWRCIQVIAQIQQNKVLEYIAYDSVCTEKNVPTDHKDGGDENLNEKSDNTGLLIGISVVLALLIIGLAILVFYFQKKNKSLMNQVKHVSFQQNNTSSSDPDLLLAKN
jgi:hypothetical protein